jgi:hypothetical protein
MVGIGTRRIQTEFDVDVGRGRLPQSDDPEFPGSIGQLEAVRSPSSSSL